MNSSPSSSHTFIYMETELKLQNQIALNVAMCAVAIEQSALIMDEPRIFAALSFDF